MKQYYKMKVAGCDRELPCVQLMSIWISPRLLCSAISRRQEKAAELLLEKCPEHDVLVTAEAKESPLL